MHASIYAIYSWSYPERNYTIWILHEMIKKFPFVRVVSSSRNLIVSRTDINSIDRKEWRDCIRVQALKSVVLNGRSRRTIYELRLIISLTWFVLKIIPFDPDKYVYTCV